MWAGHTLAIMSPTAESSLYAHPQWLSRAWCIAEGYETVAAGLRLTVGLTAEETAKVRAVLRSRSRRTEFLQAMTTADIRRAKAFANKGLVSALVAAVPEGAQSIVSSQGLCRYFRHVLVHFITILNVQNGRICKFPGVCNSGAWNCSTET